MKRFFLVYVFGIITVTFNAQNDFDVLLATGVDNAQRFADGYLAPATNGLMHSMNANWFNSAKSKPLGGFEISVVANASLINDDSKLFLVNMADYNSDPNQDYTISFEDGSNSKLVATALGENNPDVDIIITYQDPILGPQEERITLPSGIGNESANLLPTVFLQGSVGLGNGIELKARFVPKIETDEFDLSLYGAGLQVEVTELLPASKIWPVAVSGLIAYTHLDSRYDLTDSSGIDGDNQRLGNDTNTWLFQVISSTKMPVINFYAGLGYISGTSESDLLGTYTISRGPLFSETVTDPFSVSSDISAVRGTIGTKLKLGFFRLNAEYHISEFDAFSLGINFGFR